MAQITSYLITGGCGFIGTSLIKRLLEKNPHVKIRVLDNLSVGTRDDLAEVCDYTDISSHEINDSRRAAKQVELIAGDIKNYQTCLQCASGVDILIHLAANTGVAPSVDDPRSDMESNVIGTFNLLEAARLNGVDKFIFASSGAPIGEVEPPITETKPARPVSPYGASKLAGEGYCSAYFRTFGVKTVSLRFGNVYGPRSKNKNSVVAKFLKKALSGDAIEIYGDGQQTRDFIYIDDLIQAIELAVHPQPKQQSPQQEAQEPWGEVYQIATYRETTVNEITDKIKELIKREKGIELAITYTETRIGDVKRNYSDITKARTILGYDPKYDLDKGLANTLQYFLKR
jgi:UDP-glucose 4-epimerase